MTRKEEIKQASENYYNEVKYLSDLSAFPIAAFKAGAEWADGTMVNKACEWLEREYAYNGSMSVLNNELIEAFRKAMEE